MTLSTADKGHCTQEPYAEPHAHEDNDDDNDDEDEDESLEEEGTAEIGEVAKTLQRSETLFYDAGEL